MFLDRRQRQKMGLHNCIAAYISEFKYQFEAQDTTDLEAHFDQHYENTHHRCCMGFCATLKAYFLA